MNYKAQINKLKKENSELEEALIEICRIQTSLANDKLKEAERIANSLNRKV
jgi:hypothetical protein